MSKSVNFIAQNISYDLVDDKDVLTIIETVKSGIRFLLFTNLTKKTPFTLNEWSGFLNMSERTLQRYKKNNKKFDSIHSEKIVEIILLNKLGTDVFGDREKFNVWLNTNNLALWSRKPKALLDSSFGINLVKDELTRIEQGILS